MTRNNQLRIGDFPFSVELATRFDDMDLQGHINNVAIANLYQESRLQFHRELFRGLRQGHHRNDGVSTVLADIHITYRRESHYPAPVTVGCGLSRLGNSSYTIRSAMFQGEHCVGSCDAVLVYVKDGKSHPIPADERNMLVEYQLTAG